MFDALAHLGQVAGRPAAAMSRAVAVGVVGALVPGRHPGDAARNRALAVANRGVLWATGLHPWWVHEGWVAEVARLTAQLDDRENPRPVALGELGLDFGQATASREVQRAAFRAQLALARQQNLPVVLHIVGAHGPALDVMETDGLATAGGMVHGFTGAPELARRYLALGLYISIGPLIRKQAARRLRATVASLPIDRILVETDSPDQMDQPADLPAVVAAVAALRAEEPAEVARYTTANAARLFGVSPAARRAP
jgi:TatD DNase family protein